MKPTLFAVFLCFVVLSCTYKQSSYGHEEETLRVEGKHLILSKTKCLNQDFLNLKIA